MMIKWQHGVKQRHRWLAETGQQASRGDGSYLLL